MTVQNPHDKFFRESFSRIEVARNFLEEYLPYDVSAEIQLDTLTLQSESFVDETLREHQTDLLYQAYLSSGETGYIYLLFEHKSYPDAEVAFQLLRYMVRIWTRMREDGQKLQPIIPIVIYHGERKWNVSTDFQALFAHLPSALQDYTPQYHYLLRDFSHRSETELRGDLWLLTVLLVLRSILSPTLSTQLPDIIKLAMKLMEQHNGLDFVYTILYYLSVGTDKVSRIELEDALEQYGSQGNQIMATLAQQWVEEGIQQGIRQGIQQGKKDALYTIARNLLPLMNDEQIHAVTNLPLKEIAQIRQVANRPNSTPPQ